jgi:hypothetical protein
MELKTLLVLVAIFFSGCYIREYSSEKDFRNYLRDAHPYSKLERVDFGGWGYIVHDTLKSEKWLYSGYHSTHDKIQLEICK